MTRRRRPIGLGLAALGRPGYLTLGHGADLGPTAPSTRSRRARTRCSTPRRTPACAGSTRRAPTAWRRRSSAAWIERRGLAAAR